MPYTKVHYGTNLINNILLVIIFCIIQLNMQSKTEYFFFLKIKSENEKKKLVWFNCLIWALSIFVSSTMGILKIKIEKTNFCLFLTEWNSRHWGTIKADNWTKMCKTTLPIWYWTEKSGKWNTWKGLTACYIKADVGATPLEIVVAFHSMIFSQHFLFNT